MPTSFHNQKSKNKTNASKNGFSGEFIGEQVSSQQPDQSQTRVITHRLGGILGLGKTIEFGQPSNQTEKPFFAPNHLEKEQTLLFSNQQQELKQAIEELRKELFKLIKSTKNLDNQTEKAVIEIIAEPSEYQISFLERLKNFIISFRQNISEASFWLETFNNKKGKKGAFWSKVKNKKGGGEQYLFSSEHSASRSAS
jgi:hypothetical protein